ncbi:Nucleoporin nup84 [Elasticomyces elasticus]|nr:Nucleoporin nup84 [Elasticomyces elasticus]KAK4996233.1 hypothetical protein LTR28_000260 [Elasticomyces elasticus]
MLGEEADLMADAEQDEIEDDESGEEPRQASVAEDKERQTVMLKIASRTYYELDLLVRALKALHDWRQIEAEHTEVSPPLIIVPPKVRKAFEQVKAAMKPILRGILENPLNDNEAAEFREIRTKYIPELLLAYNTVLCSAGHVISRDALIESMDLSTVIAAEDPSRLLQPFQESKRITELLTSFAYVSKAMLKLGEKGKPRKEKRNAEGRTLAIWEISA